MNSENLIISYLKVTLLSFRQLEDDLEHSESEKESLRAKLKELEFQLRSNSKKSSEDIQRFIAESPAPERVKSLRDDTIRLSSTSDSDHSPSSERLKRSMENMTIPVTPESEEIVIIVIINVVIQYKYPASNNF